MSEGPTQRPEGLFWDLIIEFRRPFPSNMTECRLFRKVEREAFQSSELLIWDTPQSLGAVITEEEWFHNALILGLNTNVPHTFQICTFKKIQQSLI